MASISGNTVHVQGFIQDFFCLGEWGGRVFSHASMKHVNVGVSGGIPPRKMFKNLASLRLILVQFECIYSYA